MASRELAASDAEAIDPEYTERAGYDAAFLRGGVEVALPRADGRRLMPAALTVTLKYHHFSLRLHRRRKLAAFTAVNIGGDARAADQAQPCGDWAVDPRAPDDQARQPAYRAPFQRGQLVGPRDAAWGPAPSAAAAAADACHWSNCAPQHAQLRRSWWAPEAMVLAAGVPIDGRLSVFAGPVLHPRDPQLRDVQVPLAYWKVIVWRERGLELRALGLLVRQDGPLRQAIDPAVQMPGVRLDPELPEPGERVRGYQIAVARIALMTGLHFGPLAEVQVDTYTLQPAQLLARQLAPGLRPLRSLQDMAVG
ncbi:MAG: DNA/RNA non-specific endonuclease [Steroidobacteraceae bacterium]